MLKARTEKFKLTEDYEKFANEVSEDILPETKKDTLDVEERLLHSKYKETARAYVAGAGLTDQAMRKLLPKDVVKAHKVGIIHLVWRII